jgi:predicted AAA+ superfamily ATPase
MTDADLLGPLIESFAVMEILRLSSWSDAKPTLLHYRTQRGDEVDLVLEHGGKVFGIEVKASETPLPKNFRGLHALASRAGKDFAGGTVLHCGQMTIPFGENLWAVPISALWAN